MSHFLKIITLAGLLALATGSLTRLAAQTLTTTAVVSLSLTLPKPATIQTAPPNRVYAGTVTRTSVGGKVTTGDILLSVTPGGEVNANITTDGNVHPYFGQVAVPAQSTQEVLVKGKPRTGVIRSLHQEVHALPGGGELLISTAELALTVQATSAHGTATYLNGSTLTFTAARMNFAAFTSGNPIVISPGSGGVITILPTTPGNGG